jgi:hypothetical protein
MRTIAIAAIVAVLALPEAWAQPLTERIVAPPPPPGMAPRSGTYREPSAGNQLDVTVKPRRHAKKRKARRR